MANTKCVLVYAYNSHRCVGTEEIFNNRHIYVNIQMVEHLGLDAICT